jgi:hypothetical protein
MKPPTCRFCGQSEWSHRCGRGLAPLVGVATEPTETPKAKAAAKFAARKAGKK